MAHMLATPSQPIYLSKDHIATEATTLRAKHNGKGGFTISAVPQDAPAKVLFTVDSRSSLSAPRRLIKDATGADILELWRNHVGDESYIGQPQGASPPLAIIAPRKTAVKEKVDVYVKNAARGGEETKLEIRGQDIWKRNTLVYHGDDLVMQMRFVNYVTSYVPFSSNQWDVVVTPGVDLSLACAIVVYLGTTLYDSTKYRSNHGLEETDRHYDDSDKRRSAREWASFGFKIGILAGAAGGGAS